MGDQDTKEDSIPQLSEQYHKARKLCALCTGLLLAWTLIGIKFVGESPNEPLAIKRGYIDNAKLTLSSPEVFPAILAILIIYFSYRTMIEWHQCDRRRRFLLVSRLDFMVGHVLGALSLFLFTTQNILHIEYGKIFIARAEPLILGAILSALSLFLWTFSKFGISEALAIIVQNDSGYRPLERFVLGLAHIVVGLVFPVALVALVVGLVLLSAPLEDKILEAIIPLFMILGIFLPEKWLNAMAYIIPSRYHSGQALTSND